ncbi:MULTISPECIES: hypothetical protein [Pseudonocardia]|uniref:Uncharacterized protein n=2 Tax=Pseudonocardia TaxID=1847 RepID=A0A1Y2MZE9_PSEAH|nr:MULTISPECIES: hypothetical protein [Pseudonocardia]OSY40349.1 hypothetical protein BG845_02752 [Pseudonocardia autotrophica]TDN72322.1 hypothetical protein C8E95_1378 [Pseudonocardia autotrophica]BBG03033.1 hypothetical protein Pdca_42420 [Pseudonocardia autotrophica]GEC23655.1 hypothetical protein PSA01_06840 [Pseudonocardia saturnea]
MTDTITARRVLGLGAAAGTLPYLWLKISWLSGNPLGIEDPNLLQDTSFLVANAVTVLLAICVSGLAAVLGTRWALRAPAVVVLLPGWVGTGLLLPTVLVAPLVPLVTSDPADGIAGWVTPTVYSGFAVQGVFLLAAFALFVRDRWWRAAVTPSPVPEPVRALLRATAGGGAVFGTVSAALQLIDAAGSGSFTGVAVGVVHAGLAVTGVVAVLALAAGRAGPSTVIAAWAGSSAPFAAGLWAAATAMTTTAGGSGALLGLADLTGLLSGFALAVAALIAVSGSTVSYTIATSAPRKSAVNG